jgi:hypothetical protein
LVATDVQEAIDELEARLYVRTFNGRNGDVLPVASDYDADQIDFSPAGTVTASQVQEAIEQLDNLKLDQTSISDDRALNPRSTTIAPSQQAVVDYIAANTLSALLYRGGWDSLTNTPVLTSGVGTAGDFYIVTVASSGVTNLDGITDFASGDQIVFNGTVWESFASSADVTSFNGRQGAVLPLLGDYDADLISVTPTGNLTSNNAQDALVELQTDVDTRLRDITGELIGSLADVNLTGLNDGNTIVWSVAAGEWVPGVGGGGGGVASWNGRIGVVLPENNDYNLNQIAPPVGTYDFATRALENVGRLNVDDIQINANIISTLVGNTSIVIDPAGTGTVDVQSSLNVQNLRLSGSTITSNVTNGNVFIDPNGSGDVTIQADMVVDSKITTTNNLDLGTTGTSAEVVLRTPRGAFYGCPAARVGFAPRTSNGTCSTVNSINVANVTRTGTGIYQINFIDGTIGGQTISSTGLFFCTPKTTQDNVSCHIDNWGSSGNGAVTVRFHNQNGTAVDPTGGTNNYQAFIGWA